MSRFIIELPVNNKCGVECAFWEKCDKFRDCCPIAHARMLPDAGEVGGLKKDEQSSWDVGAACAYIDDLNYDDMRFVLGWIQHLMHEKRKGGAVKSKGVILRCGSCSAELGCTDDGKLYFDKSVVKGKKAPFLGKYWSCAQGQITVICACGNKVQVDLPVK